MISQGLETMHTNGNVTISDLTPSSKSTQSVLYAVIQPIEGHISLKYYSTYRIPVIIYTDVNVISARFIKNELGRSHMANT